jgi:hypothetical protein
VLDDKTANGLSDRERRVRGLGWAAEEVKHVHVLWQDLVSEALAQAGKPERIDARSLKDRAIEREATIHLGAATVQMERRGIAPDQGDANRQVAANNREREQLLAELADLKAQPK